MISSIQNSKVMWIAGIVFFLLLLLPLFLPYLEVGYQIAHDREVPYMRVQALRQALEEGQIPPRWFPSFDGGYGSPYPSFYAMLFYYIAVLISAVGISIPASVEITAVLVIVFSGLAMFVLVNALWGPIAGLLSGVLYAYAPYHLVDAFVRGAYSELTAFIWFPLIIFGFNRLIATHRSVYIFVAGFSIAGLILSHNIMTMLFLPFVLFYVLLDFPWRHAEYIQRPRIGVGIVVAWLLGLGLSAFFWLPVLAERNYVRSDYFLQFDYQGDFVGIRDLLSITQSHQLTTEIGLVLVIGSALAVILFLLGKLEKNRTIFLWTIACGGLALFMTTRFSSSLWAIIPFLEFTQFPWRFLALVVFFLSLACGALPVMISNPMLRGVLVAGLIIGTIALSQPLLSLPNRLDTIDLSEKAVCSEVWGTQDYRPIYSEAPFWRGLDAPEEPGVLRPCPKAYDVDPVSDLRVSDLARHGTDWHIQLNADAETSISISQFFYPGWIASDDGNQLAIEPNRESGTMRLSVPKGTSKVTLEWRETEVRAVANLVTLITLIGLLIAIAFIGSKELHHRR